MKKLKQNQISVSSTEILSGTLQNESTIKAYKIIKLHYKSIIRPQFTGREFFLNSQLIFESS